MRKKGNWKKVLAITACLATVLSSMGVGSNLTMAATNNITATVDNSVDKSTVQVIGVIKSDVWDIAGRRDGFNSDIKVYDSGKVKVDYSNPKNDYIQSLIEEAEATVDRYGAAAVGDSSDLSYSGHTVEESKSSYDHRIYHWVTDEDSSDDVIYVGDEDDSKGDYSVIGANKNRHMVIEGDYALNLIVTVTGSISEVSHSWDDGVVTKEATTEEEGILTYTCSHCRETKTEAIPKKEPVEEETEETVTQIDVTGPVPVLGESPDCSRSSYTCSPDRFIASSVAWYQRNVDGSEYSKTTTYEPGNYHKVSIILAVGSIDDSLYGAGAMDQIKTVTYNGEPVEFEEIDEGYAISMEYIFDPMIQTIAKPEYKGNLTADGNAHSLNEFYDLSSLPKNTYYMGNNREGNYVMLPLEEILENITVTDPVEDQFMLRLPVGYRFEGGTIEMECPYKVLEAEPDEEKPFSYKITDGAGQNYILGSGETLTFTCDAPLDNFENVAIDGSNVDKSSYTAVSGSTILTLSTEYLDTLAVGEHSIQFLCSNGESDVANFTVKEAEEKPGDSDHTDDPEKPDDTEKPNDPAKEPDDTPTDSGNTTNTDNNGSNNTNNTTAGGTTSKNNTTNSKNNTTSKTASAKNSEAAKTTSSPKTGDTTNAILWAILFVLSACELLIVWSQRKRSITK